jgi:hypothetical protein
MIFKGTIIYGGLLEDYDGKNLNHNEEIAIVKITKEFPFNINEIIEKDKLIDNECLLSIANKK